MLARRLAVAIGLLCGLLGTQWPEFSQQYRQRLGGALDELRRVVAAFDAEAASRSLTPAEGVARLKDNADPLARERGADIESDIARESRLEREIAELRDAGPLRRLIAMAGDFDSSIASETLRDFEPAVPVTPESLIVGALALVWGWGATHLCAWPIRRQWRARRAARRAGAA
ncbi:MAG: DUF2937 family protein [Roseiarcus sp.]|jgi:hypothetical protein